MSVDTVHAMEMSQRELSTLQVIIGQLDKALENFDDRLIGADEHAMDDVKGRVLHAKEITDQRLEEVQQTIDRMQQTLPTAVNGDASTAVNGDASTAVNGNYHLRQQRQSNSNYHARHYHSTASTAVNGGARRKKRYSLSRKLKARSSRKKRV